MLFGSTFVCPTEIIAFSDNIQQFQAINCDVVGVSTDSHFSHLAWINTARKVVLHLVHFNFLDARYVSSIEKRSIWHQCKKYEFDYQCTTDRQPTSQFGKIQMIIALQPVNRSTSCLFLGGGVGDRWIELHCFQLDQIQLAAMPYLCNRSPDPLLVCVATTLCPRTLHMSSLLTHRMRDWW